MNSVSFILIIGILYLLSISFWRKRYVPFTINESSSFKGILSILIILSHVNFHADLPFFLTITKWAGTKVALFFFISGYGLISSFSKKGKSYLNSFFSKRVWKIIFPLVFISSIFIFLYYLDTGGFNGNLIKDLLKGITPLPYSWFAYIIIIFYTLFYFVFKTNFSIHTKSIILMLLAFIVSLILYKNGFDRAWWVSNLAFPFGMIYKLNENKIISISRTKIGNFAFVPVALIIAGAFAFLKIEILYVFSYIFIVLAVIVLLSYSGLPQGRLYNFLGKVSYETYLIHGGVYYLLRGNNIYIQNNYLYLIVTILLTLILAYIFNLFFTNVYKYKT